MNVYTYEKLNKMRYTKNYFHSIFSNFYLLLRLLTYGEIIFIEFNYTDKYLSKQFFFMTNNFFYKNFSSAYVQIIFIS